MPDIALLLLGLAWAWFGKKESTALQPQPIGPGPDPYPYMPPEPAGYLPASYTPPWPAAQPSGLPPFPGAGWEYDEPPPAAVQKRAGQLVTELWNKGSGAHRIEQTAGRWIAYRAEMMRSKKRGVVAYRQKSGAARPAAPAAARTVLTSTSPGMPQLPQPLQSIPNAGKVVQVQAGHWYQFTTTIACPEGCPLAKAVDIAAGLRSSGAVNVVVSKEPPPFLCVFVQRASVSSAITIGKSTHAEILGQKIIVTPLDIKEVAEVAPPPAPPGPPNAGAPYPLPPGATPASYTPPAATSPLSLPVLRYGMGLKPQEPVAEVKLLQHKLQLPLVDGRFGGDTRTAVINFQKKTGLAPNISNAELLKRGFGVVKEATWVKLFGVGVRT